MVNSACICWDSAALWLILPVSVGTLHIPCMDVPFPASRPAIHAVNRRRWGTKSSVCALHSTQACVWSTMIALTYVVSLALFSDHPTCYLRVYVRDSTRPRLGQTFCPKHQKGGFISECRTDITASDMAKYANKQHPRGQAADAWQPNVCGFRHAGSRERISFKQILLKYGALSFDAHRLQTCPCFLTDMACLKLKRRSFCRGLVR